MLKGIKMEMNEVLKQAVEQAGDNEALKATLSLIQTGFDAEQGKKTTMLGEVKDLKEFKNLVRSNVDLQDGASLSDIASKFSETMSSQKTAIDSLSEGKSTKDLKISELMQAMNTMQGQFTDLQANYDNEKATTALSTRKDTFRTALANAGITKPESQDLAIKANLSEISSIDDLGSFASTFAESNSFLKDSVHRGGTGGAPSTNTNVKQTLADCTTKAEEAQYYQSKIDADVAI